MWNSLRTLLVLTISVGGIVTLQLPRLRTQLSSDDVSQVQQIEAAEAVERDRLQLRKILPAFGFDNLVSSWTFLNFLYYFGNQEARQAIGYNVLPEFFDVIIHRDPYFYLPYRYLSSSVTLFAGQPATTVQLLEQGLNSMRPTFPANSFWLWRFKAIDELLFLGDTEAAIQSMDQAAVWASQSPAPDAERSVRTSQRIATFLRQDPDSRQVQATSWAIIWNNAINEEVRQYAQAQIEALGYFLNPEGRLLPMEGAEDFNEG